MAWSASRRAVQVLLDRLVRSGRMDLPTLVQRLSPGPRGCELAPAAASPTARPRTFTVLEPRAPVDGLARPISLARGA